MHLTPQQLANRLNIPLNTVYAWRVARKGPPAMKIGKHIRYRLPDVQAWEQSRVDREAA
ncbi:MULTISPECIES: helix-turn-helix domain-containing protein [Paenarthrobacter]|uniref:helix-turn-helix domain-containing protein n=1 Tax=Paenarthrobacter TaxID=1742992 RepID=UPI0021753842|nr:helix-turn-helix domain-containing protein [Paenarthrobacter ureafaciens]